MSPPSFTLRPPHVKLSIKTNGCFISATRNRGQTVSTFTAIKNYLAVAAAIAMSAFLNAGSALAAGATISGPIPGSPSAVATTAFDLSEIGYQQSEFFMSGTASSYLPTTPLSTDGYWSVNPVDTAPYTTRLIVYRPTDPRRFNGTVYVEWVNVSTGGDFAADWLYAHDEVTHEGAAYRNARGARLCCALASALSCYAATTHAADAHRITLS
jgi:Alpha/beta hydrolase domain